MSPTAAHSFTLPAVLCHASTRLKTHTTAGFSMTELLVVVALVAVLSSLAVPAWSTINRGRANRVATGIVMDFLERARSGAISGRRDVWVVFRHAENSIDGLRIASRDGDHYAAEGPWLNLPAGISFLSEVGTALEEKPPKEVIQAVLGTQNPSDKAIHGGIMFLRTGRIAVPLQGGNQLAIPFHSAKGNPPSRVIISRATGRASCAP